MSSGCFGETSIAGLNLGHIWTTTMSSREYRDTIQVHLTSDGVRRVFSHPSAFKELDPIPQFRATAKLDGFLEARFSQSF